MSANRRRIAIGPPCIEESTRYKEMASRANGSTSIPSEAGRRIDGRGLRKLKLITLRDYTVWHLCDLGSHLLGSLRQIPACPPDGPDAPGKMSTSPCPRKPDTTFLLVFASTLMARDSITRGDQHPVDSQALQSIEPAANAAWAVPLAAFPCLSSKTSGGYGQDGSNQLKLWGTRLDRIQH